MQIAMKDLQYFLREFRLVEIQIFPLQFSDPASMWVTGGEYFVSKIHHE